MGNSGLGIVLRSPEGAQLQQKRGTVSAAIGIPSNAQHQLMFTASKHTEHLWPVVVDLKPFRPLMHPYI